MFCPVCISAAIMANAPAIAAGALGGAAAVKAGIVCINNRRQGLQQQQQTERVRNQPRTMVDPLKINRYDEEEY
ncbi:hypothetical protein HYH03_000291 [Edaphochlamys debaryana]|uniref:Uncharacterized protein n=1 Tax=Edaphochlamys debaryana TaxID=47281 RepID=A0A836C613_9CHLO|nr:hypothetical protein HYH03_000291 [Edaphochlamys debaryana]|eukprot:KAG2501791.1 hypothetical protein HYH03_000291 [Edaphochlamys debaryana]